MERQSDKDTKCWFESSLHLSGAPDKGRAESYLAGSSRHRRAFDPLSLVYPSTWRGWFVQAGQAKAPTPCCPGGRKDPVMVRRK
jgi:hypothetical protein